MNTPWRHCRRILLTPDETKLPDVALFGRYNYTHAAPALPLHAHKQCMEFCFLLRGRQAYRVGDVTYRLTGGDIFVTFPDEPHDTAESPEEKGVLYWVILRISKAGRNFLGLEPAAGDALRTALLNLPSRQFRAPKGIATQLDALMDEQHRPFSPLRTLRMQNRLVTLLLAVVQAANHRGRSAPQARVLLARLKAMIGADISEPVSIPALAATAGLSVPRFKVWFKEQTGIPPGEYILRHRVEAACHLLSQSHETITNIGHALGFSSSQYFATVIKRFTGLTPGQVRRAGQTAPRPRRASLRQV